MRSVHVVPSATYRETTRMPWLGEALKTLPCAVCGRAIAYSEAVGLDRTADKRFVESSPRVQAVFASYGGAGGESREACDASAVAANRCCFPA